MNFTVLPDSELLKCIGEGDKAAFHEIYVRHWREVFLHSYKRVRNKQVAEELTQNLFLSLWERRKTDINDLRLWLLGAVKFAVINYYKAQIVHEKYESYVRGNALEETYSTEQLTLFKDLSASIEKGISLLPLKTRQVFTLSRFENRSTKEISRDLGISEKAVEYHITQSLKWMRLYLKEFLTVFALVFLASSQ